MSFGTVDPAPRRRESPVSLTLCWLGPLTAVHDRPLLVERTIAYAP